MSSLAEDKTCLCLPMMFQSPVLLVVPYDICIPASGKLRDSSHSFILNTCKRPVVTKHGALNIAADQTNFLFIVKQ